MCCPCRCCASCVTGPASAPVLPPSAPQVSHWCWMAAGAARCVPGSEASPALRCFPATAREDCSATTAPASPETPGSVSVSASSNEPTTRPMSVWVGQSGGHTASVGLHEWDKQLMFKVCSAERDDLLGGTELPETLQLLFPGLLLTHFL